LSELGYTLNDYLVRTIPIHPEIPEREQFEEQEDYEEAIEEYNSECADFAEEKEEIESLITYDFIQSYCLINTFLLEQKI